MEFKFASRKKMVLVVGAGVVISMIFSKMYEPENHIKVTDGDVKIVSGTKKTEQSIIDWRDKLGNWASEKSKQLSSHVKEFNEITIQNNETRVIKDNVLPKIHNTYQMSEENSNPELEDLIVETNNDQKMVEIETGFSIDTGLELSFNESDPEEYGNTAEDIESHQAMIQQQIDQIEVNILALRDEALNGINLEQRRQSIDMLIADNEPNTTNALIEVATQTIDENRNVAITTLIDRFENGQISKPVIMDALVKLLDDWDPLVVDKVKSAMRDYAEEESRERPGASNEIDNTVIGEEM